MPDTPILSSGLRLVQEALAQLPPEKTAAVVLMVEQQPGQDAKVTAGVAAKFGDGWSVAGKLEQKLKKEPPTGVLVVTKTW